MKRLRISHTTRYSFDQEVTLLTHRLLIRPRAGHDIRVESSNLDVDPPCTVRWQRDLYGNSVGLLEFKGTTKTLRVASEVIVQHFEIAPLDFLVDVTAVNFPFQFDSGERIDLIPYQMPGFQNDHAVLREWCSQFWKPGQIVETFVLLDTISKAIVSEFQYRVREEPGVQRPSETLRLRSGSCRDFATLFIETCRFFGLAARFVSGYLHEPSNAGGAGSTHAWSEVYLPGAGWKGFDNTSGLVTGVNHIATAVSRHPETIPPISGSYLSPAGMGLPKMEVAVTVLPA